MLASYSPAGGGIFFFFLYILVLLLCLTWIAFWLPRRFHANSAASKYAWLIYPAFIGSVFLCICFPAMRRTGTWETDTNERLSTETSYRYDRMYFGYIPQFSWIGSHGIATTSRMNGITSVGIDPFPTASLGEIRLTIDWLLFPQQLIAVLLGFGPFLRKRRAANSDHVRNPGVSNSHK